jgi:hypothetical protein
LSENEEEPMAEPMHGYTKHGLAVHAHVHDHLPEASAYQRVNKKVAVAITKYVGTMTCFWIFCLLALCSLPYVLSLFSAFSGVFPAVLIKISILTLIAWIAQTFLQLVLLPSIMVGQNLQNVAADARSTKTFEDVETVLNLLDIHTQGGLKDVLDAITALKGETIPKP